MPARKSDFYVFGGVDSRSNLLNFPAERSLRMRNFCPLQSGRIRLRFGYSAPTQTPLLTSSIHTLAYYTIFGQGQSLLMGQGTRLISMNEASGQQTDISPAVGLGMNGTPWGHFNAYGRFYLSDGGHAPGGNPIPNFLSWDGANLRPVGVPAPTAAVAAAIGVTVNPSGGSWLATSLSGYTLYIVYFNPITGAVSNRTQVGQPFTVTGSTSSLSLTNLPNTGNPEQVIGFGITNDGGQVPYWLVNQNGQRVTAPGFPTTTATIVASTFDVTQQLPTRNGLPDPALNAFTKVGNRVFGIKPGSPNIFYSEDATTYTQNQFIGVDVESWAGDGLVGFPTGENPTCIQSYRLEGWFFSLNYLALWNPTLAQQTASPWRGPWQAGCAGQRAFVETPYGPVWLTPQKQLMTFNQGYSILESAGYFGPTPLSSEYERSLLGQIGDQYIDDVELGYLRDPELEIDRVYVLANDVNGNPIVITHDFLIRDERSQQGQGYDAVYSGMNPTTIAGSGVTPRQNVFDVNNRERLWVGSSSGFLFQLEDGSNSDSGNNYTGDWISIINSGNQNIMMEEIQWEGDQNAQFSYSVRPDLATADWTSPITEEIEKGTGNSRRAAHIGQESRWAFGRFQLTSHPADGTLIVVAEEIPVATYGRISMVTGKMGGTRTEGR